MGQKSGCVFEEFSLAAGIILEGKIPSCGGQFKGKIPRHGCNLLKSPYMQVMNLGFSQNHYNILLLRCYCVDREGSGGGGSPPRQVQ